MILSFELHMILTTRSSIQRARWCRFRPFPLIFGSFGGHFGTFWNISGHLGTFWIISGHFGLILGHFGTFLNHFGTFLGYFESFRITCTILQHDLTLFGPTDSRSSVLIQRVHRSNTIFVFDPVCSVKIMLDRRA